MNETKTIVLLSENGEFSNFKFDFASFKYSKLLPSQKDKMQKKISSPSYVIITTTNSLNLEDMLTYFENSIWRNIEALFFIVNEVTGRCLEAENFLQKARKHDILNVIYLCENLKQSTFAYLYNPVDRPDYSPWKMMRTSNKIDGSLTVYQLSFNELNYGSGK